MAATMRELRTVLSCEREDCHRTITVSTASIRMARKSAAEHGWRYTRSGLSGPIRDVCPGHAVRDPAPIPVQRVPEFVPDMETLPEAPVSPAAVAGVHAEMWALIQRAQAGDADAFGVLYEKYRETVFRFIYYRVGNRPLAEDLTSDTFLRALKRIGSFTWQGRDLGAWLVTIARNLVADHFKSGRYRLEVTIGDVQDVEREDRDRFAQPEAATEDYLTSKAVMAALLELNPAQREVLVLRFLRGYSVAETAAAMGKEEGAIKALQWRATRALARLIPGGLRP